MNIEDLRNILVELDIPKDEYSLYGSLRSDSIILYQNYIKWEVFYLDERGGRNNERTFTSESEACLYILKIFTELQNKN